MNRRDFTLGGLGGFLTAPVLALGAEYISASDMPL